MSPEQLNSSRDVESATDVWSLGVVLYQLVSGAMPFYGHTLTEVATKIALQPPTPLKPLRPDVPSGLEAVITRCLQKAPADRYLSVADLAVALVDFAPRRARVYVDRIAGVPPARKSADEELSAALRDPRGRRRFRPTVHDGIQTRIGQRPVGPGRAHERTQDRGSRGDRSGGGGCRDGPPFSCTARRERHTPPIVGLLEGGRSPRPPRPGRATHCPWRPPRQTQAVQEAPFASASAPPATPARPLASSHPVVTKQKPRVEPVPAATPHAPAPPASAAPGSCKVVSFFDSDGNQHFKQDCGSSK